MEEKMSPKFVLATVLRVWQGWMITGCADLVLPPGRLRLHSARYGGGYSGSRPQLVEIPLSSHQTSSARTWAVPWISHWPDSQKLLSKLTHSESVEQHLETSRVRYFWALLQSNLLLTTSNLLISISRNCIWILLYLPCLTEWTPFWILYHTLHE